MKQEEKPLHIDLINDTIDGYGDDRQPLLYLALESKNTNFAQDIIFHSLDEMRQLRDFLNKFFDEPVHDAQIYSED